MKNSIKKLFEFEKTGQYWIETEPGQLDALVYDKGQVMIEFLIDIKRLTYSEILDKDVTGANVINEMKTWYNKQKEVVSQ